MPAVGVAVGAVAVGGVVVAAVVVHSIPAVGIAVGIEVVVAVVGRKVGSKYCVANARVAAALVAVVAIIYYFGLYKAYLYKLVSVVLLVDVWMCYNYKYESYYKYCQNLIDLNSNHNYHFLCLQSNDCCFHC